MPRDERFEQRALHQAVSRLDEGIALREADRTEEALAAFDDAVAVAQTADGAQLDLVVARGLYAKAHYLMELERCGDAVAVAGQAHDAAMLAGGREGALLRAQTRTVSRDSLTDLRRFDEAVQVDEAIVADCLDSEDLDLRARALRALSHATWVSMQRDQQSVAGTYADRLLAAYWQETIDAESLVCLSEIVLSCAATLDWRRSLLKRPSSALCEQASRMREAVIERAREVGGNIGAVTVINAKIAVADALAQDHRLRRSFGERMSRPALHESELLALDQVQEQARVAGADSRYIQLSRFARSRCRISAERPKRSTRSTRSSTSSAEDEALGIEVTSRCYERSGGC